jgi:hypothetical protein
MEGPEGVKGPQPACGCIMVWTIAGLVPQGPDNHRGVVFVPDSHTAHPVGKGKEPAPIPAQMVIIAMAFDIRLINDIKTILIAQVIPDLIVGIVARPDRIDVMLFHEFHVLYHRCKAHGLAGPFIMLVPINPLNHHPFSIHQKLPIPDFHTAEPKPQARSFQNLALLIQQCCREGIEPGSLGGPEFRRFNRNGGHTFIPVRPIIGKQFQIDECFGHLYQVPQGIVEPELDAAGSLFCPGSKAQFYGHQYPRNVIF